MLNLAARIARRFRGNRFLSPQADCGPRQAAVWNAEYAEGFWDHLFSIDELAHYMVVAGYVTQFQASPAILDVGCGAGRLFSLLSAFPFECYVGIDVSDEAIRRAALQSHARATFEVARLEEWCPNRKFDSIVFCESLYYAERPAEALEKYAEALSPEGVLVVSQFHFGGHAAIWKQLENSFSMICSTTVEDIKGLKWDVRVLRPYHEGSRGA